MADFDLEVVHLFAGTVPAQRSFPILQSQIERALPPFAAPAADLQQIFSERLQRQDIPPPRGAPDGLVAAYGLLASRSSCCGPSRNPPLPPQSMEREHGNFRIIAIIDVRVFAYAGPRAGNAAYCFSIAAAGSSGLPTPPRSSTKTHSAAMCLTTSPAVEIGAILRRPRHVSLQTRQSWC